MPPPERQSAERIGCFYGCARNGFQSAPVFGDGKFLCVLVSELSIEFLSQNIRQADFGGAAECVLSPIVIISPDSTGIFLFYDTDKLIS